MKFQLHELLQEPDWNNSPLEHPFRELIRFQLAAWQ